ncbi:adenylyltransferase/cytidyltransferase family protein [Vibrio coralliirubri]|uniref:adenylyltransferase/cytidyltransferase family protein n=1 Tax=Vibrio coralliirubri TaxID=1516159 RepID=UPI002283BF6A|nr:adenylyltransferase/cytidyltransferase family protein [Vibrio coralliirubri]MCY9861195.1 adenylyltransferase/cytidyltransferase family protein [Vibrio coralliirubri]
MASLKIGIFGSAFNPPTKGHGSVITRASQGFDEVWVIPSANHAFGKVMLPLNQRADLVEALIEDLELKNVRLVNCEQDVSDGVVYTIDLLDYLKGQFPDHEFTFLCGQDNIDDLHKFHRHDEILERHAVTGFEVVDDVRSTYVRESIASNTNLWEQMVTPSVEALIKNTIKYTKMY